MSEGPKSRTPAAPSVRSTVVLLILTTVDTTWRMFVPILLGLVVGLGIDALTHLAPLFTIICLILGVPVSIWLVLLQVRAIQKGKK